MRETLLWTLERDGDTLRALMSTVDGGFELRLVSGSLQVFRTVCDTRAAVQFAATRERTHLLAQGWTPVALRDELTRGDHVLPGDTVNELEGVHGARDTGRPAKRERS